MNTNEIVIHEVQSDGVLKILNLLAEGIRQAREATVVGRSCCQAPIKVLSLEGSA
jgi:hypothetical protein